MLVKVVSLLTLLIGTQSFAALDAYWSRASEIAAIANSQVVRNAIAHAGIIDSIEAAGIGIESPGNLYVVVVEMRNGECEQHVLISYKQSPRRLGPGQMSLTLGDTTCPQRRILPMKPLKPGDL